MTLSWKYLAYFSILSLAWSSEFFCVGLQANFEGSTSLTSVAGSVLAWVI